MAMLSVWEGDRGSTYILHVRRIFESYLPFGKIENGMVGPLPEILLLQLGKTVYKVNISKLVTS